MLERTALKMEKEEASQNVVYPVQIIPQGFERMQDQVFYPSRDKSANNLIPKGKRDTNP